MAIRLLSAIILLFTLAATSCRKDDMQRVNSDILRQAILTDNPDQVEIEINKVLSGLQAGTDSEGNFKNITNAISSQCKVTAVPVCYNCIQTNPTQSEIKISIALSTTEKVKIIDISYSANKKYVFAGMHD